MNFKALRLLPAALLLLVPAAAQAHTGGPVSVGFWPGFWHPFSGLDHVLAMVAVGLLAAQLGGRALWLVPLSFVSVMAIGGLLGTTGFPLPFVELAIASSVLVLGLTIALGLRPAVASAMGLVGAFAIFHGFAHGAEMPAAATALAYGTGFVVATALLHAAGIGAGLAIGAVPGRTRSSVSRMAGGAIAVAGAVLMTGIA